MKSLRHFPSVLPAFQRVHEAIFDPFSDRVTCGMTWGDNLVRIGVEAGRDGFLVSSGLCKAVYGPLSALFELNSKLNSHAVITFVHKKRRLKSTAWFRSSNYSVNPFKRLVLSKSLFAVEGSYGQHMLAMGLQPDASTKLQLRLGGKNLSSSVQLSIGDVSNSVKLQVLTFNNAFCKCNFDITPAQLRKLEIGSVYQSGHNLFFASLDLLKFHAKSSTFYRFARKCDVAGSLEADLRNGDLDWEVGVVFREYGRFSGRIGRNRCLELAAEFSPRKWLRVGLRSTTPHSGLKGKPTLGWFLDFSVDEKLCR
jgi:hypothetical protein